MSFDLDTFVPAIPEDLQEAWLRKLRYAGLFCEFHPAFNPRTWRGGFCPINVRVLETKFPTIGDRGPGPWVSGFELDVADFFPLQEPSPSDSSEIGDAYAMARRRFSFGTKTGRSILDLTLQYYAAATVAAITNGVLFDPQSGKSFVGQEAIRNAARKAEDFAKSCDGPAA